MEIYECLTLSTSVISSKRWKRIEDKPPETRVTILSILRGLLFLQTTETRLRAWEFISKASAVVRKFSTVSILLLDEWRSAKRFCDENFHSRIRITQSLSCLFKLRNLVCGFEYGPRFSSQRRLYRLQIISARWRWETCLWGSSYVVTSFEAINIANVEISNKSTQKYCYWLIRGVAMRNSYLSAIIIANFPFSGFDAS